MSTKATPSMAGSDLDDRKQKRDVDVKFSYSAETANLLAFRSNNNPQEITQIDEQNAISESLAALAVTLQVKDTPDREDVPVTAQTADVTIPFIDEDINDLANATEPWWSTGNHVIATHLLDNVDENVKKRTRTRPTNFSTSDINSSKCCLQVLRFCPSHRTVTVSGHARRKYRLQTTESQSRIFSRLLTGVLDKSCTTANLSHFLLFTEQCHSTLQSP